MREPKTAIVYSGDGQRDVLELSDTWDETMIVEVNDEVSMLIQNDSTYSFHEVVLTYAQARRLVAFLTDNLPGTV